MKPTTNIPGELLDNKNIFTDSFYRKFTLRPADEPLKLSDEVSKNYLFPTFYGDVTAAMGIFLCDYEKAKKLLPHPGLTPVSMLKGRALVIFSCYEYKKVLGVAPYNEIAMTIPVMFEPAVNFPILPILTPWFKSFGYYCFSMPVTSLENQIRGQKIWGLPKVVEEIDIQHTDATCTIHAYDENNQKYFDLTVPKKGQHQKFDVTSNLYTMIDNQIHQSETNFTGDFYLTKNVGQLLSSHQPALKSSSFTWLGSSAGKIIQELDINPTPFQTRYCDKMQSTFDLPISLN